MSYKTVARNYLLPLSESEINALNRLNKNPSISEKIKTVQKEWNLKQFKEIEVIGDKVKVLNYCFDLETFYKQYKRLIDCLYYFDYSYCKIYEEEERANNAEGEYFYTSILEVCHLDNF